MENFIKLDEKELMKIQEHVDKKKDNEYEVIEFFKNKQRNKSKITIKHKKCNIVKTINYYTFLRSSYKCNCVTNSRLVKSKYTISDLQEAVDKNFGKNVFKIVNLENGLNSKVTVLHVKCNTEFITQGNYLIKLKDYSCKCGERIISHLSKNTLPLEDLRDRLFKKTNGRIIYKEGYKGLTIPCKFYDKKCGREFEMIPDHLLRFNYSCPLCYKKEEREKSIKLWQSRLEFYKVNDIQDRKLCLECKTCHKQFKSSLLKEGNKLSLCKCEDNIKNKITDNLIDINISGKTENMSEYLKENNEYLLDLSKYSFVSYDVKDSMNNFIINETNKYKITSRVNDIVRDTLLTYKKVNFKFDNFKYTNKSTKATFKLLSFTAIDINKFNIRRIFNVVIERHNGDINDFNFYIDNSHLFHLTNDKYKNNIQVTKAIGLCFRILLLFNKKYSYTKNIKDYESNSTITPNNQKNNKANIVEYKELRLDLKKEKVRIINKGHTTRKITCNFPVSGHFRHYKSGKTTFVNSFEKGKEFKNIRRIEKNYIIK